MKKTIKKIYNFLGRKKVLLMQCYYYLKYENRFVIKKIQGSKMKLDIFDRGISFDLLNKGIKEPEETNYFKNLINNCVLDIGANTGYYSLMESKDSMIYAVEPELNNYLTLKENIELNKCKNIKTYHLAFGDRIGKCKLLIHPTERNLHSVSMNRNFDANCKFQEVRMTTVDNFLKNKRTPNIIMMDVEGSEYEIIKGMKETLKKRPMVIYMELHNIFIGTKKSLEILNTILNAGFYVDEVIFDKGQGLITPNYLRKGYKKFEKRKKIYNNNNKLLELELKKDKSAKFVYGVFFKSYNKIQKKQKR